MVEATLDPKQKEKFWSYHAEQWQKSGQSQTVYCCKHGLKWHNFHYWRKKLGLFQSKGSSLRGQLRLVPLDIKQDTSSHSIDRSGSGILLSVKGVTIEVEEQFKQDVLRDVINVLRG